MKDYTGFFLIELATRKRQQEWPKAVDLVLHGVTTNILVAVDVSGREDHCFKSQMSRELQVIEKSEVVDSSSQVKMTAFVQR